MQVFVTRQQSVVAEDRESQRPRPRPAPYAGSARVQFSTWRCLMVRPLHQPHRGGRCSRNSACRCAAVILRNRLPRLLPVVVIDAMIPMRPVAIHLASAGYGRKIGLIVPEAGALVWGWKVSVPPRLPVRPHLAPSR